MRSCSRVGAYERWSMRKTVNIMLIAILAIILVTCLVACGNGIQHEKPTPDGGDGNGSSDVDTSLSTDAYLKFYFMEEMSSVFNAIELKNFDISDVYYAIVYVSGKSMTEENCGPLTIDMVNEEDRALLSQKGHHNIRVSVEHDNKTVYGSFALHLQDSQDPIELVDVSFSLKDNVSGKVANAYFGTTNSTTNTATVQIEKGLTLTSWNDVLKTFRMSMQGMAISSIKSGSLTITPSYFDSKSLTINSSMHFVPSWTEDVVDVTFDLNVPNDATPMLGYEDPRLTFNADQKVARNIGTAVKPTVDSFNVFDGYYFAGWYLDDGDGDLTNDRLWSFSARVGVDSISLYGRWVERAYTYTIYTTGGEYPSSISNSEYYDEATGQREYINNEDTAIKHGLKVVDADSRFGIKDGVINRITVKGMKYGDNLSKYVVRVQINDNGDMRFLTFRDVFAKLQKGNPDYVKIDNVYRDLQCTEQISSVNVDGISNLCFIKWVFNDPEDEFDNPATVESERKHRLSKYILDVVFANGYTLKQDGSIRLDKIADTSINELVLPATVKLDDGIERPITEIGKNACMNLKGLVTLDLRNATYLTTIGAEAFSHCVSLHDIYWPGYTVENGVVTSVNSALNNLQSIGEKALYRTPYEMNYAEVNGGCDMIIIGSVLYKYIGSSDVVSIDLSTSEYYVESNSTLSQASREIFNSLVTNLKYIANGAFGDATNLETITLGAHLEKIGGSAFVGTNVGAVNVGALNALKSIESDAFDGTPMLTNSSDNYNNTYGAIIIGDVYYRYIKNGATATIPANIRYISADAFESCVSIVNISFENSANIIDIGRDAFFSTEWVVNDADGFVMVNGILAEYYNMSYDAGQVNISLLEDTKKIANHAFGSFAQYVKTVLFNAGIEEIGDYAFSGASSLDSFIFTEISVTSNVLKNAPMINDKSFIDAKGNIVNNAKFFVRSEVMDCLQLYAQSKNIDAISDEVTKAWVRFYIENEQNFIVEDVSKVYIDEDIISTYLLKIGTTDNAFTDTYGSGVIANALIIESNTGVLRHEDLDPVSNNLSFITITNDPTNPYYSLYSDEYTQIVATFTYHGSTSGCQISVGDEHLYIARVVKAIKNPNLEAAVAYLPFYSTSNNKYVASQENVYNIDGYNKENNNFWIEGFSDKDFIDNGFGTQIPVFYTSFGQLNVRFGYKNIHGEIMYLDCAVSQFSTNVEKTGAEALFEVDFYGIGTYKFKMQYIVKVSKYIDIEQSEAISIPLNGNAQQSFAKYNMNLVGQDGSLTSVAINLANFGVVSVDGIPVTEVDTSTLGIHKMVVRYVNNNAVSIIEKELVYTVILEADEAMFNYEVISEKNSTARIVSCQSYAKNVDTIVLPTRCMIDGKEYIVVEIGRSDATTGVFENFTSLKAVYLSATIGKIHPNTFRGCTLLEGVHSAQVASSTLTQLTIQNLEVIGDISVGDEKIKEAKLVNLYGVSGSTIAIGASYRLNVGGEYITYNIVQVADELKINDYGVEIFMPNTIVNYYTIKDLANNVITPNIYSAQNNYMFRTEAYLPQSVTYIGSGAFANCQSLVSIDLSKAVSLEYIGANAFENSALKQIDLSNNTMLLELNNQVFAKCVSLKKVVISDNIAVIGIGAFNGCCNLDTVVTKAQGTQLTNVVMAEYIAKEAFSHCSSLYDITIASTVSFVDDGAFTSCDALVLRLQHTQDAVSSWSSKFIDITNPIVYDCLNNSVANDGYCYSYVDGIMYGYILGSGTAMVVKQQSCVVNANIRGSIEGVDGETYIVTVIDEFAFADNANLESVFIASSVTTIKQEAFSTCTALTTVTGGDGLTSISKTAFEYCDALTVVPTV